VLKKKRNHRLVKISVGFEKKTKETNAIAAEPNKPTCFGVKLSQITSKSVIAGLINGGPEKKIGVITWPAVCWRQA